MAWDPKIYMSFGEERTRAARELLARVGVEHPKRVVDLGSGPGNSTALLAARWPDADIEGIDNSQEMLDEARKSPVPARWTLADVASWNPDKSIDVIFSNATFQWIPGQAELLPRIVRHLSHDGVFAFQVPRNHDDPSHTIILDIAKEERWRAKLSVVQGGWNVHEPNVYFDILEPYARTIDIWETRYVQVLEGDDAVFRWVSGTGLRPFANALEGSDREDFLAEYRARVARAYPPRKSGITLFPFRRLFCVMRK